MSQYLPHILLTLWTVALSSHPTVLDQVQIATAEIHARSYARRLSAPRDLKIRVEIVPDRERIDGTTVRGEEFFGCILRLPRSHLHRMDTIAHETCHCVNDYEFLTPYGYRADVTEKQAWAMERAATACEAQLVREDVEGRKNEDEDEGALGVVRRPLRAPTGVHPANRHRGIRRV